MIGANYLGKKSHEVTRFIWERNSLSLTQLAKEVSNTFWTEVMIAMAQYDRSISAEVDDISRHSVWFSNYTKFKNGEIKSWKGSGIVYINDLLKENGDILSFHEAKNIYKFSGTMLDYQGLVQSLPNEWKNKRNKLKEPNPIIHPNIQNIITHKQGNKYIYNTIMNNKYKDVNNTWESGWERELGQIDWVEVYKSNRKLISVAYQSLQYKILTKIIATNRLLYQMGRSETFECDRCAGSIDSIIHRFWYCPAAKRFWDEVELHLRNIGIIRNISVLNKKVILLGDTGSVTLNHIIIVGKMMIARKYLLSKEILLKLVKRDMQSERKIVINRGDMSEYDNKWAKIAATLD